MRLEGRRVSMLAQVVEDPDTFAITLHVAALHRQGEAQRYPLSAVEFLSIDRAESPPSEVRTPDGFDAGSVLDGLEWDAE